MSVILRNFPVDRGESEPLQAGWGDGSAIATPAYLSGLSVRHGALGPAVVAAATTLPNAESGKLLRGFMDWFYFRIWMMPRVLDAQNPQIGSPIPFRIWNSFLAPNEVQGISVTGSEGLELSLEESDILSKLELKLVTVTITPDAPYQIDSTFSFDFEFGDSTLRFLAQLADILPVEINAGITERFEWLTDILENYDGTEQRIALRGRPRRTLVVTMSILSEADRKAIYDKLYATIAQSVIVPAYQYQSILKRDTVIGDNKIYCNPKRADLRAGESVILVARNGSFFFYKIDQVFEDHVTITTAFSQVISKRGAKVVGGFTGRMPDNSALTMNANSGSAQISITIVDSRDQIAVPDYPIPLPIVSDYPVLMRRPLADGEAPEAFGAGLEVIDNETGKPAQFTAWNQRYVSGERKYLINSLFDKDEMQFWRTFLDYCRGRQRAFLTPTWRADLVQVAGTDTLVSEIDVEGSEYATLYFSSPTYKHLLFQTDRGDIPVVVTDVVNNGISTKIYFNAPVDADLTGAAISRISYLMLCRLGSDTVTLTHENTYSTIELTLRAVQG
jgi:hypothetical protein